MAPKDPLEDMLEQLGQEYRAKDEESQRAAKEAQQRQEREAAERKAAEARKQQEAAQRAAAEEARLRDEAKRAIEAEKRKKQDELRTRAEQFLRELDPKSKMTALFNDFAKGFPTRLEAAIAYLEAHDELDGT